MLTTRRGTILSLTRFASRSASFRGSARPWTCSWLNHPLRRNALPTNWRARRCDVTPSMTFRYPLALAAAMSARRRRASQWAR
jgi:hypothetical protein